MQSFNFCRFDAALQAPLHMRCALKADKVRSRGLYVSRSYGTPNTSFDHTVLPMLCWRSVRNFCSECVGVSGRPVEAMLSW